MNFLRKKIVSTLIFILAVNVVFAQFYNGLQNDFGKNRVQYKQRDWQFYRFDKYDVYFYQNGKELANFVSESINRNINALETTLDFMLEDRIEFVVYNKQTDFKQSNIGLVTNDPNNIGGSARIVGSKVFIYFEGDHQVLEKQIKAAVAEALLNQWLYGGSWKDRVKSSTLLNLPDWYTKGLVFHLANQWDYKSEEIFKDGILSGRYKKFSILEGKDAVIAGASIWKYVSESYGKEVIPNLVYLAQVSRNVESGFTFVIGSGLKVLMADWYNYYYTKYSQEVQSKPSIVATNQKVFGKTKKNIVYSQFKISPDGKYAVYATNQLGQIKLFLCDLETKKRKRILKKDKKLDRYTDYTVPLIAWHPSSQIFAFVYEEKGDVVLNFYDFESKKIDKRPPIYTFEKILDISYAPDGKKILMSAVQKGQSDIFLYNLISNTPEQITKDVFDDLNPRFIKGGKEIIFSSNRFNDSIKFDDKKTEGFYENNFDLFVYDYSKKSKLLRRATNTPNYNEWQAQPIDTNHLVYFTDQNNSTNRFVAKFDSTISYVDTTEHYRFFLVAKPLTKFSNNVFEHNFNSKSSQFTQVFYQKGRYRLSEQKYDLAKLKLGDDGIVTAVQNLEDKNQNNIPAPSNFLKELPVLKTKKIFLSKDSITDSRRIDFNNYVFESEKNNKLEPSSTEPAIKKGALDASVANLQEKSSVGTTGDEFTIPKQLNYFRFFTLDQFTSQFNNNFVNQTYQKFTGGEVFFNPGINGLVQIGMSDAFEDYRMFGGFKLSADLKSNEFLVGYEDRSKRWDKTYSLYRQSFPSSRNANAPKILSHVLTYALRYPFSEVAAFKTSLNVRNDRSTYLSNDLDQLIKKTEYNYWTSLKAEYIFDNSLQKAINIYNGIRFKIYGEYFNQLDSTKNNLQVVGADFRFYQKIHKNFIFAFRAAGSSSFGTQKLIYYLGSTDNWINLSTRTNTFNRNIPIAQDQNYAFQALATNMRGFNQNVRNGSSFGVINNELRMPLFTFLYNRPLRSDFLTNFQVIGFYDAGTAWSGLSPFSNNNEYNSELINSYPVSVTLKKTRQAFVYGYGWGLRSRLFGYFVRCDWAWGVDDGVRQPRIFYLSLATDF